MSAVEGEGRGREGGREGGRKGRDRRSEGDQGRGRVSVREDEVGGVGG